MCRVLSRSLSSPVCGYLGKLLSLSSCCFGLQSSEEAFPQEAEGERHTMGDSSDSNCFWCACPPAPQQPLELWKLPDQWKNELDYRLQGAEMSATFFSASSSLKSCLGWLPRSYHQDTLHVQSVRCIVSFHLSVEHEVLATRLDLQLNGKSYSVFPGPQER